MKSSKDTIAVAIAKKGYYIADDVLLSVDINKIKHRFVELQEEEEQFEKAGIGKQVHYTIDKAVRGDFIRWIDDKDQLAPTYNLFEKIQALISSLNRICFLGVKDFETHYAYYPKGGGYKIHRDRFKKTHIDSSHLFFI